MTPAEHPNRIGKYELEEFLGGGMSHVYRARDTVIGRTVAVKILTEAGCQDEEAKTRFLAEARMAGNIEHDNVMCIYDFGEDDQHRPFMVMEFLRGEDLRHAIRDGRTGDLKSKLKIALQVAKALQYIHTQKIVHRDIKPENVHITADGVVKLMDFGIAKTEGLAMTRAGYVLGTPFYMAPEQVMGHEPTEQVDVYAFGILLFELMTGGKPIGGDSVERIFYSILNEPLNLEPLQQSGAPQAICDLVGRCTMKTPAERPQGMAPVSAELERMVADLEAPTALLPVVTPEPPPPRPAWVVPAILALIVVVGLGLYFVLKPKPPVKLPKTLSLPSGDMVLVEEGTFLYGALKESVLLKAFYVDRTEVTNRAYGEFCDATHHDRPQGFPTDKPAYPVVNVAFADAKAFASWAGKRLPTGPEWEKAARGNDGRVYPWGDAQDPARANVNTKELRPATDFPEGASPCGALNMVGNVWEWTVQSKEPAGKSLENFSFLKPPAAADEPWYLMRGTSFLGGWEIGVTYEWVAVPARLTMPELGFRCVKDPETPQPAGGGARK